MGDEEEQRATLEALLMTAIDQEPLSTRRRFR